MPEIEKSHSTPTCSRRSAILGTAAAGIAATMPALASPDQYSPEFREWYALARTINQVAAAYNEWERTTPDWIERQSESPWNAFNAALEEIERRIHARPVRSWADVAELGMIALFWSTSDKAHSDEDPADIDQFALGRDPDLECDYQGQRATAYLIQAVAKLAMQGGGHV